MARLLGLGRIGVFGKLVQQGAQSAIRRRPHLLAQAGEQMGPPFAEIGDERSEPVRMQRQAQHIHRRPQQLRVGDEAEQPGHRAIGGEQRPVPVDRERRIGLVPPEDEVDRALRRLQRGVFQRTRQIDRRIARGEQQRIALAQRHGQMLGEQQHHLPARARAAAFDEAQMLLRDLGFEREVELAEAAKLAPVTEQGADGWGVMRVHGSQASDPRRPFQLPPA